MSTITHSLAPTVRRRRVGMPFPPDKRRRVAGTAQEPWSGTGLVSASFPDATVGESTGFVIGDRYVVTAAHAVYNADLGGLATRVRFQPARDAGATPFNTFEARAWRIPAKYPAKDLVRDDYCLLVLATPMPPEVVPYHLTAVDDSTLRRTEYQIAGYPDDKQPDNSMWYAAGAIASVDMLTLQYRISTSHGQSGAAVASYLDTGGTTVVGIHSRVNDDDTANVAVRVTQEVIAQIEAWKQP